MAGNASGEGSHLRDPQSCELPPELVWERTFLVSSNLDRSQHFRSNSAPAAMETQWNQQSVGSANDLSSTTKSGGSGPEQLHEYEAMCKDTPSADRFGIGDIVTAISDFCIDGVLAVMKGCKGTVMCHGEMPDGSVGVSVQFEKWKEGKDAYVLCRPDQVQVVAKAPSAASFGIGATVAATSDFCIGGVLVVEKGCRGTVICHGERPDGSIGVSVQFEARKDGKDAAVLCLPQQIEAVVSCLGRTKRQGKPFRKYVTSLEDHLELIWASMRSVVRSMENATMSGIRDIIGRLSACSFSSSVRACACILLGVVATFGYFLWPSVPLSEKVIIEDTEVYSQVAGRTLLNQCVSFTRNYLKIQSKRNITVCGTQTKVIVFLRNKCGVYSSYQHELGTCNVTETPDTCVTARNAYEHEVGTCNITEDSSTCVTASPSTEKGVRWLSQAQSYRIELCSNGAKFGGMLWQNVVGAFFALAPCLASMMVGSLLYIGFHNDH